MVDGKLIAFFQGAEEAHGLGGVLLHPVDIADNHGRIVVKYRVDVLEGEIVGLESGDLGGNACPAVEHPDSVHLLALQGGDLVGDGGGDQLDLGEVAAVLFHHGF